MARTTRILMQHVVNPVVRALLRSPAHDVLGDHVAELAWTGRRSGRSYSTPVNVVVEGDAVTVVTRRGRTWWRNLIGGAPVRMTLHGRERQGAAGVLELDSDARAALLGRVLEALGHPISPERAAVQAEDVVVVRVVLDPDRGPRAEALRGRPLWARWTRTVTAGEAVGFLVPAVVVGVAAALGASDAVLVPLAILAGAGEGAVLGFAQALVLRRAVPDVSSRAWIRATVLGAVVAWAIGTLPMLLGGLQDVPVLVLVLAGVPLGMTMLLAMGGLQARVLRGHVDRPHRWIGASAVAWLAALSAFAAVTSPLWQPGQDAALTVLIGVLGGLVMAAAMASLTGMALAALTVRPVSHRIRVVRA